MAWTGRVSLNYAEHYYFPYRPEILEARSTIKVVTQAGKSERAERQSEVP